MGRKTRSGSAGSAGESRPVFWKELYWFALICLGAWILGVYVLTPRLARSQKSVELERDLVRIVRGLSEKEQQYQTVIAAMENDPYYREAVYRAVLGVRKKNEKFLKTGPVVSDKEMVIADKTVTTP